MTTLEDMRGRIEQLDEDILRLIAERMTVAKSIGRAKKDLDIPLRDWEVERRVLERAVETAARLDLSPEVCRTVMQALITESRVEQERHHYSAYQGATEQIVVVGGAGKMGQWLARFFSNQGHHVWVHDIQHHPSEFPVIDRMHDVLERASIVAVATPLEVVPQTIDQLAERRFTGTVFDIASLKGHLVDAIARARERGLSITSMHPMFGPDARTLSDKVICLCDCGDADATRRVEGLVRGTAATLVHLSLEEHDEIVSYVLGLSHLLNIVFAKVLVDSGMEYEHLRRVESTTFLSQMRTTASVIRENPSLYYAIQRCNPLTPQLYQRLHDGLETVTGWVLSGNRVDFEDFMNTGRQWLDGHDTR